MQYNNYVLEKYDILFFYFTLSRSTRKRYALIKERTKFEFYDLNKKKLCFCSELHSINFIYCINYKHLNP